MQPASVYAYIYRINRMIVLNPFRCAAPLSHFLLARTDAISNQINSHSRRTFCATWLLRTLLYSARWTRAGRSCEMVKWIKCVFIETRTKWLNMDISWVSLGIALYTFGVLANVVRQQCAVATSFAARNEIRAHQTNRHMWLKLTSRSVHVHVMRGDGMAIECKFANGNLH